MYLIGRMYIYINKYSWTYRKGCLNPAIAISFQMFEAGKHNNPPLFFCSFGIICGSLFGAICGAFFFKKIYQPFR
jgi:hypothetical protein